MPAKLTEGNDTVLLIWNYILTFEKEVAFFWKRGLFSGACVLFLANRYLVLVVAIYQSPWWNLHYSYAVSLSVYLLCGLPQLTPVYTVAVSIPLVGLCFRISLTILPRLWIECEDAVW